MAIIDPEVSAKHIVKIRQQLARQDNRELKVRVPGTYIYSIFCIREKRIWECMDDQISKIN